MFVKYPPNIRSRVQLLCSPKSASVFNPHSEKEEGLLEQLEISSGSCSEGLAAASEALVSVERNDLETDVEGDFSAAPEAGAEVTDG